MIRLCTCTGGSTSTISSSKRRGATASCKTCGGKPAIDGKGSSSSCLLSTVLELTCPINTDLTWTKVSKGYRSSSRRPRRSNTINLDSEELLIQDSKGLEMPISESEKLGVSVLGCHFSERAEHVPIKKRRFLFRTSSPPRNTPTPSSEGTVGRSTCFSASSHGLQLKPNATCLTAASAALVPLGQRCSDDDKVHEKKLMKASKEAGEDEDFSGISILAAAACSNSLGGDADLCEGSGIVSSGTKSLEAPGTVQFKEGNVKSANMCTQESDSHTSTAPSKGVASSTVDYSSPAKSTLDNCSPEESTLDNSSSQVPLESTFSKTDQEASKIQKPSARDDRLNWDLNTVMDAWEEPFESQHEISVSDTARDNVTYAEEKKRNCKEGNSGDCDLGRECGSASKSISNVTLPVGLKSLAHENEESKLEERKPDACAEINLPLSPESEHGGHVAVKETDSLCTEHIYCANNAIPVSVPSTPSLENSTREISAKCVNLNCKRTGDLGCYEAASMELSMDCSIPPGFDNCLKMQESKENVGVSSTIVGVGNNITYPVTTTQTVATITSTSEEEKCNLSLMTAASLENGAHQIASSFNEDDDEARVKIALTSNGNAMEDLVTMGTDLPKETDKGGFKAVNQTTFGSLFVKHSSVVAEFEDQPVAVSSMHDAAVPLDSGFGYENSQSDNRAGSGVDKVDELSVGYDSQYEDGELRESSMHAWKGYEGEDGENEYGTDNRGTSFNLAIVGAHETSSQCGHEGSSRTKFTDVGSGREADVVSSVPLPERLQSSDNVSGSGLNEMISGQGNSKRQDVVRHTSQSDKWKMNVSGWDILPENHRSSSSNFTNTRDFSSRKFSSREQKDGLETEDVEAKAEGSRFYRREPRIGGPSTRDAFFSRGRFRMQGCSSNDADDSTSRSERELGALRSFGRGRYSPHSRASGRGGGTWNRSPERGRDVKRLPSPSYQGPSFVRSMLDDVGTIDNMTNEGSVDPSGISRPNASSYVTRRSFRSRSPRREENEFRARLGLRPTGDTSHDRFVNVGRGRGRSVRYGSRFNGGGARGRYHGPGSDDCDDLLIEYSHPSPRRRRCFSPVERRGNHPYANHRSDSRSPSRPSTRSPIANGCFRRRSSRSPDFRMRRPRSPNYRGFEGDHTGGYTSGPRNNTSPPPPPNSRWVNYKPRSTVFDRRSPPPGRIDPPRGERFTFYDSSRKPRQNEYYRSGHPGRFSELNEAGRGRPRYTGNDDDRTNHGYKRGGFVRRYNMDGHVKRFQYEDDGFGLGYDSRDKHALELHARGNPKPNSHGTDSRFRDFPRRVREEREPVTGDFKRRSREEREPVTGDFQRWPREERKDDFEKQPKEDNVPVTDDFQRRLGEEGNSSINQRDEKSTNLDSTKEVVKEDDEAELGSNYTMT